MSGAGWIPIVVAALVAVAYGLGIEVGKDKAAKVEEEATRAALEVGRYIETVWEWSRQAHETVEGFYDDANNGTDTYEAADRVSDQHASEAWEYLDGLLALVRPAVSAQKRSES